MRKKIFAAVFMVFALTACGNQDGENGGNMAEGPVSADMEGLADGSARTGLGRTADGSTQTGLGTAADGESPTVASAADVELPTAASTADREYPAAESAASREPASAEFPDGVSEQTIGTVMMQKGHAGTLQVTLPEGWIGDTCPEGSELLQVGDYGIHFYPEDASEGFIELCYVDSFGVCGTGLEEELVTLAGDSACIGTYDHGESWDFVSFQGTNEGIVALTYGVDDWWPEYGEQVLEILDTVSLEQNSGDGLSESGADAGTVCRLPLCKGLPLCNTAAQTVACGTDQEPPADSEGDREADSWILELGLSLEVTECTGKGAVLVFRQSGGNPAGELSFGDAYQIQRYEDGEWTEVPVVITGTYGFHEVEYLIPPEEDREFSIDWEWLYGELEPGEYRIRKEVEDFRKTADYDVYEIYAYFDRW